MSDIVEINDVFLHKFTKKKYIAFKIERGEVFFLFLVDGVPQCSSASLERISVDYEYLGKSKANIEDLFEVQKCFVK